MTELLKEEMNKFLKERQEKQSVVKEMEVETEAIKKTNWEILEKHCFLSKIAILQTKIQAAVSKTQKMCILYLSYLTMINTGKACYESCRFIIHNSKSYIFFWPTKLH